MNLDIKELNISYCNYEELDRFLSIMNKTTVVTKTTNHDIITYEIFNNIIKQTYVNDKMVFYIEKDEKQYILLDNTTQYNLEYIIRQDDIFIQTSSNNKNQFIYINIYHVINCNIYLREDSKIYTEHNANRIEQYMENLSHIENNQAIIAPNFIINKDQPRYILKGIDYKINSDDNVDIQYNKQRYTMSKLTFNVMCDYILMHTTVNTKPENHMQSIGKVINYYTKLLHFGINDAIILHNPYVSESDTTITSDDVQYHLNSNINKCDLGDGIASLFQNILGISIVPYIWESTMTPTINSREYIHNIGKEHFISFFIDENTSTANNNVNVYFSEQSDSTCEIISTTNMYEELLKYGIEFKSIINNKRNDAFGDENNNCLLYSICMFLCYKIWSKKHMEKPYFTSNNPQIQETINYLSSINGNSEKFNAFILSDHFKHMVQFMCEKVCQNLQIYYRIMNNSFIGSDVNNYLSFDQSPLHTYDRYHKQNANPIALENLSKEQIMIMNILRVSQNNKKIELNSSKHQIFIELINEIKRIDTRNIKEQRLLECINDIQQLKNPNGLNIIEIITKHFVDKNLIKTETVNMKILREVVMQLYFLEVFIDTSSVHQIAKYRPFDIINTSKIPKINIYLTILLMIFLFIILHKIQNDSYMKYEINPSSSLRSSQPNHLP